MVDERMPQHAGEVGILNVGAGDTKLSFDPKNPAERIRAARVVRDMLRRGYALLIETSPGVFTRATDFREDVCEYVIADFDPVTAAEADAQEESHGSEQEGKAQPETAPGPRAAAAPVRRGRGTRSVPAENARAVVVAPVAGG